MLTSVITSRLILKMYISYVISLLKMVFSEILRAAFYLSAFSKIAKKKSRSSLPSSFFLQIFRIATTITEKQFSTFPIPLIMLKTIKMCRGPMRMAYFPIFENALRSAITPKMSEIGFVGSG